MLPRPTSRSCNATLAGVLLAAGLSLVAAGPVLAQEEETTSIVSLYRVAPGQHIRFIAFKSHN